MSLRHILLVALFASLPSVARAAASEPEWDGGYGQRAERRSGFAASIGVGVGFGVASGYPNDVGKLDDPDYRTKVDPAFSTSNTLWLGGALQDWFTLGLGISGFGTNDGDQRSQATAFIFHLEVFPLWSLGGAFRDLSTYANFGAGGLTLEGGPQKGDGGLVSVVALGSSYDLLRVGHFVFGPTLDSTYVYSRSGEAVGVFAGVRTVFYGGP